MSHAEIEAEVEAMRLAILSGVDYERPKRAPKPRRQGPGRGVNLRDRPPRYDREKIRALVDDGLNTTQIAEALGAHRGTVWKILQTMDLTPASGAGKPRQEYCARGLHLMKDHARESKYGRYCHPCKAKQAKEHRAGGAT